MKTLTTASELQQTINSRGPVALLFSEDNCVFSQQMIPELCDLEQKYTNTVFAKAGSDLGQQVQVVGTPTLLIFKDGKRVHVLHGYDLAHLRASVRAYCGELRWARKYPRVRKMQEHAFVSQEQRKFVPARNVEIVRMCESENFPEMRMGPQYHLFHLDKHYCFDGRHFSGAGYSYAAGKWHREIKKNCTAIEWAKFSKVIEGCPDKPPR
eukprot:gene18292-820_t